jgi:hypothetical protein
VDQNARKAESLLHAAAERADERAPLFGQSDEFQHVRDRLFALGRRDPVAGAEKVEVLGDLHVLVDAEEIRHVADDMADGVGVGTTSWPKTEAEPPEGTRKVARMRRVVVLPAPLEPMNPKRSPWLTVRLSPPRATSEP